MYAVYITMLTTYIAIHTLCMTMYTMCMAIDTLLMAICSVDMAMHHTVYTAIYTVYMAIYTSGEGYHRHHRGEQTPQGGGNYTIVHHHGSQARLSCRGRSLFFTRDGSLSLTSVSARPIPVQNARFRQSPLQIQYTIAYYSIL